MNYSTEYCCREPLCRAFLIAVDCFCSHDCTEKSIVTFKMITEVYLHICWIIHYSVYQVLLISMQKNDVCQINIHVRRYHKRYYPRTIVAYLFLIMLSYGETILETCMVRMNVLGTLNRLKKLSTHTSHSFRPQTLILGVALTNFELNC